MLVIGLTGGIATGKSTTAAMISDRGIPLHDADAAVHDLMAAGGRATGPVAEAFGDEMLTAGALSTGSGLAGPSLPTARFESGLNPLSTPWWLPTGTGFSRSTAPPARRLLFSTFPCCSRLAAMRCATLSFCAAHRTRSRENGHWHATA